MTVSSTSTLAGTPGRAGPPDPGSPALQAGLITPTDMGGYYRTEPSAGAALISTAPCLGFLGAGPSQSGRAATALLGPDAHSVPTIVEEVASSPGTSARSSYEGAVAAVGACRALILDLGGSEVSARLAATTIPPVGDADRVWSGSFATGAATFTVQIGVVLDGDEVIALLWIDSVPPSDPVMGSFVSTLSLAIGKLA